MPIYEYQCLEKGHRFELFQKISEAPATVCPECGGKVKKLISSTAFQLKGGGWYKDGYASKPSEGGPKASEPVKTETKKTTETKKE